MHEVIPVVVVWCPFKTPAVVRSCQHSERTQKEVQLCRRLAWRMIFDWVISFIN